MVCQEDEVTDVLRALFFEVAYTCGISSLASTADLLASALGSYVTVLYTR